MPTVAETINKINEFAELPEGWHFGEGMPPSQDIRTQAINFLTVAQWLGIKRTNAFPGVSGQIQVTFYHEERMLELTLETDNSITIAEDEGDTQIVFKEGASKANAYAALREFSQYIWVSSESSIVSIMIRSVKTSPVRHSTYPVVNLFQWSNANVRLIPPAQSVDILHGITASSPASRLFTGRYPAGLFRLSVGSSKKEAKLGTIATTISTVGEEIKREKPSSH